MSIAGVIIGAIFACISPLVFFRAKRYWVAGYGVAPSQKQNFHGTLIAGGVKLIIGATLLGVSIYFW